MRSAIAIMGVIATALMFAVSGVMNFRFGLTLSPDAFDSYLYAGASVGGDIFKIIAPFLIGWAWAEKRYPVAGVASTIFLVAVLYSVTSALGFAAQNRTQLAGERQTAISTYQELVAERDRKQLQLDELAATDPVEAIQAALRAAEQHRRWTSTSGCTDATVPASREFCEAYYALVGDLAIARQRVSLESDLADLNARVAAATNADAVSGDTDPQVTVLAKLIPTLDFAGAQLVLVVLIMVFVELCATFGFYISLSHLQRPEGKTSAETPVEAMSAGFGSEAGQGEDEAQTALNALPAPSDALMEADPMPWGEARLIVDTQAATRFVDLYADYCAVAQQQGLQPMAQASFERWLKANGFTHIARLGRYKMVQQVRFKDAA